jgi:hypothetical protein
MLRLLVSEWVGLCLVCLFKQSYFLLMLKLIIFQLLVERLNLTIFLVDLKKSILDGFFHLLGLQLLAGLPLLRLLRL